MATLDVVTLSKELLLLHLKQPCGGGLWESKQILLWLTASGEGQRVSVPFMMFFNFRNCDCEHYCSYTVS